MLTFPNSSNSRDAPDLSVRLFEIDAGVSPPLTILSNNQYANSITNCGRALQCNFMTLHFFRLMSYLRLVDPRVTFDFRRF